MFKVFRFLQFISFHNNLFSLIKIKWDSMPYTGVQIRRTETVKPFNRQIIQFEFSLT